MNIQVITQTTHANRFWQPDTTYRFAANVTSAPLVALELPRAQQALPIAFLQQEGGGFMPVALLGLSQGLNAYLNKDGQWLSYYIPAIIRAYPFKLANTPEGQQVLCVDEDSGLVSDTQGEPFFDAQGQVSEKVQAMLNLLVHLDQNTKTTHQLCQLLDKHKLIQPWLLTVPTDTGEQAVNGLYQIDESALTQLSADALAELMQAGAISLAYCQLLSMQHSEALIQLVQAHARAAAQQSTALPVTATGDLNLDYLNQMGGLDFSNFK
jgi:hypothetical protein